MIVDLSHPLEPGMPCYPGLPEPRFHVFMDRDRPDQQKNYAPGTSFHIASYELGGNTGTYLDAPFHRHADGVDLHGLPLERMVNLPGLLVGVAGDGAIGAESFGGSQLNGVAVLVRTDWSRYWPGGGSYFRSGPFLTRTACEYLVAQRPALVGIDCANIDNMVDPERPAHTVLLRAGIPIVEHLTNLAALEGRAFRFFAAPPAIRGGTSFVVRAFALCE